MADLPEDIREEAYIPQKLLAAILGGGQPALGFNTTWRWQIGELGWDWAFGDTVELVSSLDEPFYFVSRLHRISPPV